MPKKSYMLLLGIMLVAFGSVGAIILTQRSPAAASCAVEGMNHRVTIRDDTVKPDYVIAKLCDRLTITNTDNQTRKIGFGEHDNHVEYDGVREHVLRTGDSMSLTLDRVGRYDYHDHYQHVTAGIFVVE